MLKSLFNLYPKEKSGNKGFPSDMVARTWAESGLGRIWANFRYMPVEPVEGLVQQMTSNDVDEMKLVNLVSW